MKYLSLTLFLVFSLSSFSQSILLKGGMVHSGTGAEATRAATGAAGTGCGLELRITKPKLVHGFEIVFWNEFSQLSYAILSIL